jgi:hypothetical protein
MITIQKMNCNKNTHKNKSLCVEKKNLRYGKLD